MDPRQQWKVYCSHNLKDNEKKKYTCFDTPQFVSLSLSSLAWSILSKQGDKSLIQGAGKIYSGLIKAAAIVHMLTDVAVFVTSWCAPRLWGGRHTSGCSPPATSDFPIENKPHNPQNNANKNKEGCGSFETERGRRREKTRWRWRKRREGERT